MKLAHVTVGRRVALPPLRAASLTNTAPTYRERHAVGRVIKKGWKKGVGEVLRVKEARPRQDMTRKEYKARVYYLANVPTRKPPKPFMSRTARRTLVHRQKKLFAHHWPTRKLRYRNMEQWGAYHLGRLGVKEHEGARFRQHALKQFPGPHEKKKTRWGRGVRSGHGSTCGRGREGTHKRAGGSLKPWFEGGQKPLYTRLPKLPGMLGRRKKWYRDFIDVPLWKLENKFEDGEEVTMAEVVKRRVVKASDMEMKRLPLRMIALPEDPPFTRKLTVKSQVFIPDAKALIEQNGGTCVELFRYVPLRIIPLAKRDEARKVLYRKKWVTQGRMAEQDEETFQKLLRTDKQYLHDLIQFRRSFRYQSRLKKIELRKKAGLITTKEEEEAALNYVAPKPKTKLPPGFNPIFYRTNGKPIHWQTRKGGGFVATM